MSRLAQAPSNRSNLAATAAISRFVLDYRQPEVSSAVGETVSPPYIVDVDMGSLIGTTIASIGFTRDFERLADSQSQQFAMRQRVAALELGWFTSVYDTLDDQLARTISEIYAILSWGSDGWDDPRPNDIALVHAVTWVIGLYQEVVVNKGYPWVQPNATVDADGNIVLEWWNGQKALGVYISGHEAIYIKEWGANPHTEMFDGDAEALTTRRELWEWLTQ